MSQRTYTVDEVDRMRRALLNRAQEKFSTWYEGFEGYAEEVHRVKSQLLREVEDHLRTYIAAGVAPEELDAAVDQSKEAK